MAVERFEDLHSWQEARKLARSKEEFQEAYDSAGVVGKLVKGSIDNLNKQISSRRRDRGRGR